MPLVTPRGPFTLSGATRHFTLMCVRGYVTLNVDLFLFFFPPPSLKQSRVPSYFFFAKGFEMNPSLAPTSLDVFTRQ